MIMNFIIVVAIGIILVWLLLRGFRKKKWKALIQTPENVRNIDILTLHSLTDPKTGATSHISSPYTRVPIR